MYCTIISVLVGRNFKGHCRKLKGSGGVAQLVEHQTGTLLTQVDSPVQREIFLPVSIQCKLSAVSVHPRVQSHALTSECMLKIL